MPGPYTDIVVSPTGTGVSRAGFGIPVKAAIDDLHLRVAVFEAEPVKPPIGKDPQPNSHTGFGTSEVISLTVTNMLFKSGWAYRAYIRGLVYGTAGAQVSFRLRKTNESGTAYGEYGRVRCEGTSVADGALANASIVLIRPTGTDLTTNVVLTVATDTGTGNVFGDAGSPRYLYIEPIGTAAEYDDLGVDVT